MIKNLFSSKIKNNFLKIFLIIFLISLWSAINTDFESFISNLSNITFRKLLDVFRFSSPYIFFLIYLILYKRLNFLTKNKFLNFVLLSLLVSFSIQSVGLVVSGGNINYLHFFFLTFFSFVILIDAYNFNYEKEVLITAGIIILIFSTIYFVISYHSFIFKSPHLNLYGNIQNIENYWEFLSENSPRSSGLSRFALIISVPLMLKILTEKRPGMAICFFYYLNTTIIILAQSRINVHVFFFFMIAVFIFTILSKEDFRIIIKKIILIIILPPIIYMGTVYLKSNYSDTRSVYVEKYNSVLQPLGDPTGASRIVHPTSPLTSGRLEDWKKIIQKNDNIVFGNGLMGDRFLINQSASNILIYNYASGGIFSVAVFILLILRSIFVSASLVFIYKIKANKANILIMSSIFIQSYLILRGVAESSFAVFGIDFLIFFTLYLFSEKYYLKASFLKNNLVK